MAIKRPARFEPVAGVAMPIEKAKEFIVQLISQGHSVEDSCKAAGKSVKSYEYYRASDAQFKQAIELARAIQKRDGAILGEDANI